MLGLRHEHIRAPGTYCTESTNWRAVTPYDAASVMHYTLRVVDITGDGKLDLLWNELGTINRSYSAIAMF